MLNFIELTDMERKHDLFGFSVSVECTLYREVRVRKKSCVQASLVSRS